MTIKASDLKWAKVVFNDTEEAKAALAKVEGDVKALKKTLAEGWFDDAYTEREMRKELAKLEEIEEELCSLVFSDLFDLL